MATKKTGTELPEELIIRLDEFVDQVRIPKRYVYQAGVEFVMNATPEVRARLLRADPAEHARLARLLEDALAAEEIDDAERSASGRDDKPKGRASG